MHDKTVAELRRIFEEFKRYSEYYEQSSREPRNARPEELVVAALSAG